MILPHNAAISEIAVVTFFALLLAVYLALRVIPLVKQAWKQKDDKWTRSNTERAAPGVTDRRRSSRYDSLLPVTVHGYRDNAEAFFEDAMSLQVSAHGGLIVLATRVRVGQELVLKTGITKSNFQVCRVARFGASTPLRTVVAVQFSHPAPEFWQAAEAVRAARMSAR